MVITVTLYLLKRRDTKTKEEHDENNIEDNSDGDSDGNGDGISRSFNHDQLSNLPLSIWS